MARKTQIQLPTNITSSVSPYYQSCEPNNVKGYTFTNFVIRFTPTMTSQRLPNRSVYKSGYYKHLLAALLSLVQNITLLVTNKRRLLCKQVCLKSQEQAKFCNLLNSGETEQVSNYIPYPKIPLQLKICQRNRSKAFCQKSLSLTSVKTNSLQAIKRVCISDLLRSILLHWWLMVWAVSAVSYDLQNSRASSSHHHKSIHAQRLRKVRTSKLSK